MSCCLNNIHVNVCGAEQRFVLHQLCAGVLIVTTCHDCSVAADCVPPGAAHKLQSAVCHVTVVPVWAGLSV